MTQEDLITSLQFYFPGSFGGSADFAKSEQGAIVIERLLNMPRDPVTLTHLNQLLHFAHEAGLGEGFFRYYFLSRPARHFYATDRVFTTVPGLNQRGISSLEQLRWGVHRFYMDALVCFGDIRSAYRGLREKSFEELEAFFDMRRFDSASMGSRGRVLPFKLIPADDRYLIAEMACKAYSPIGDGTVLLIEEMLLKAYRENGGGRVLIKKLFDKDSQLAKKDPQAQMLLEFTADEFADDTVDTEDQIKDKIRAIAKRFTTARMRALENTRLYLSIVNELDVYVATSMRRRSDFRDMSRDCEVIFRHEGLARFAVRYFDPTLSAADCHEDKGLIECLMVKCAKALLYFAGESDSFGKDSEVSMALSLGKPVIILCPPTEKGEQRMKVFRDIHPLSRLIEMSTGVAVGAIVTKEPLVAAQLLERLFDNTMEYDLEHNGDGYFRLRERLTRSVVRLQTNNRMLRESFWNYYHGVD